MEITNKYKLKNRRYSDHYDAYYDVEEDIWLEGKCNNKKCLFCKDRPNKPSSCLP